MIWSLWVRWIYIFLSNLLSEELRIKKRGELRLPHTQKKARHTSSTVSVVNSESKRRHTILKYNQHINANLTASMRPNEHHHACWPSQTFDVMWPLLRPIRNDVTPYLHVVEVTWLQFASASASQLLQHHLLGPAVHCNIYVCAYVWCVKDDRM